MFLTNNYRTIYNLLLYSKGKHRKRIWAHKLEIFYNPCIHYISKHQHEGYTNYLNIIKLDQYLYSNITPCGNINKNVMEGRYAIGGDYVFNE